MKTAPGLSSVVLALALGSGCYDFTAAREQCLDPDQGDCVPADAPTLDESTPGHQESGVAVDTPIALVFSREMSVATLELTASPSINFTSPAWDDDHSSVNLEVASPLQFNTLYTIRVKARSADGKPVGQDTLFSFTTRAAPDTTPPTVVSLTPPNGSTGVTVGLQLVINFSEPMNVDSLALTTQPDFEWGEPTWSSNGATVTFSAPPSALDATTLYLLSLDASDAESNSLSGTKSFSFTTGIAPDTTKPTVIGSAPEGGSVSVSTNVAPSVSFSEPMNDSLTKAAFSITPAVTCNLAFDITGTLLTCAHGSPLAASTQYTVTIAATAQDSAGNTMVAPVSFIFTTGSTPDNTPPALTSTTPTNAGTGAATKPGIRAVFSEQMDKSATQAAFSISSPTGITGTFSWNTSGTQMTFTPNSTFLNGQTVNWQISTGARDLAGNAMASTQLKSFRTVFRATRTVYSTASEDGYLRYSTSLMASTTGTYFYVGDYSSTEARNRSFLAFDLSTLPATTTNIVSARIYVYHYGQVGTPYGSTSLGKIILERVKYTTSVATPLPSSAWDTDAIPVSERCTTKCPPLGRTIDSVTLSTASVQDWKSADVDEFVDDALKDDKVQFRLRFDLKERNVDGASDYAYLITSDGTGTYADKHPYLYITYEYP